MMEAASKGTKECGTLHVGMCHRLESMLLNFLTVTWVIFNLMPSAAQFSLFP